ncbi:phospholipid scramblase 3-like [Rhipicephalus sanguineus]|uniref:phospholipid scramblase 3-like n=1 Tax=Rhipicephalus sanguineus TaxID=34632 RepID=UPI0018954E16|nr:phospholipid scramblase 3-like [Rhipicephalus sanguineus]
MTTVIMIIIVIIYNNNNSSSSEVCSDIVPVLPSSHVVVTSPQRKAITYGLVVEVQAPPGTLIGRVCQLWSICYPSYGIYDTSGNKTLSIVGPCCTYSMPFCCDVQFQVKSANGVEVGKITKQWSGVVKEGFTDADTFGVTFPMDLDVNMKASLIAATMLIDYMFYETTCGQGSGAKAT